MIPSTSGMCHSSRDDSSHVAGHAGDQDAHGASASTAPDAAVKHAPSNGPSSRYAVGGAGDAGLHEQSTRRSSLLLSMTSSSTAATRAISSLDGPNSRSRTSSRPRREWAPRHTSWAVLQGDDGRADRARVHGVRSGRAHRHQGSREGALCGTEQGGCQTSDLHLVVRGSGRRHGGDPGRPRRGPQSVAGPRGVSQCGGHGEEAERPAGGRQSRRRDRRHRLPLDPAFGHWCDRSDARGERLHRSGGDDRHLPPGFSPSAPSRRSTSR